MSPLAPSFLAIIPARAGSKRLPDKNIKPLCGKPLLAWSIEAALNSPYISEVAISTDSKIYASLAREWGASAPFLRPKHLSSDTSTTFDALKHCIDFYKENLGRSFDYIALLQPTSPLRKSLHINQACEKILTKGASSLISVCECEHSPLWCNTLPSDESMSGFLSPQVLGVRSQDLPRYYRLNGVIFIAKTNALLESQGFFTPHTIAYTMPARYSSDIDSALDFEVAEMILARELGFAVSYTGGGAELSFSASRYLVVLAGDLRACAARDSRALSDSSLSKSYAITHSAHSLDSQSCFSQSPAMADSIFSESPAFTSWISDFSDSKFTFSESPAFADSTRPLDSKSTFSESLIFTSWIFSVSDSESSFSESNAFTSLDSKTSSIVVSFSSRGEGLELGEVAPSPLDNPPTPTTPSRFALRAIDSIAERACLSASGSGLPSGGVSLHRDKIKSREAQSESRPLRGVQKSETRRAVVPRRRFLARSGNSEALPLIAEKKKRSFILLGLRGERKSCEREGINPFSFCDKAIEGVLESKEVKSGDSERLDSESETPKIQEVKAKDSKAIDSESKDKAESTPSVIASNAKQSIKIDSKKSESATDLESKKQASRDTSAFSKPQYDNNSDSKTMDCHDFAPAKPRNDKRIKSQVISKSIDCRADKLAHNDKERDSKSRYSHEATPARNNKRTQSQADSKKRDYRTDTPAHNDDKTESRGRAESARALDSKILALPKALIATYLKLAPLTDSTPYKGGAYAA